MAMRLFLVYVLVELAVVVGLVSTIGFGWTVLALLATFGLGLALAGAQLTRQLARLQDAMRGRTGADHQALASDSLLIALGTVMMVIPGLASSVVGALLLLPPTRAVGRPLVTGLVNRQLARSVPVMVFSTGAQQPGSSAGHGEYVDGEVIDVVDEVITPAPLEHRQP